jgi:16S rRNA (adenine1518-N6/adenine1519-N6)-dimethyltransferase
MQEPAQGDARREAATTAPRQVTLARLRGQRISPDTRLGQHFLIDDNLVRVALRLAGATTRDVALEVGAGLGVLTAALAQQTRHVHAIEIDRRLADALAETLAGHANVTLVWGDALTTDLAALQPAPTILVANLPYNIATPLILESVTRLPTVERCAVMVQREVADRLFAEPDSAAYGAVSVLMRLAFERTGYHRVSRSVFVPPPNVDSALVGFARADRFVQLAPRWTAISQVVHAAFGHRRKTIGNALSLAGIGTRPEIDRALAAAGIAPQARAQSVAAQRYVTLADVLAGGSTTTTRTA